MRYQRISPNLVIKKGIQGTGVFVTKNIKKGKVLFKMKGEILHSPTQTSVQIGKNKHIEDAIGGHVNHSCAPNAKVNRRNKTFISLRDIAKGEEIIFDYNKNEDHLAVPFACKCCGKMIRGRQMS